MEYCQRFLDIFKTDKQDPRRFRCKWGSPWTTNEIETNRHQTNATYESLHSSGLAEAALREETRRHKRQVKPGEDPNTNRKVIVAQLKEFSTLYFSQKLLSQGSVSSRNKIWKQKVFGNWPDSRDRRKSRRKCQTSKAGKAGFDECRTTPLIQAERNNIKVGLRFTAEQNRLK